MDNPYIEPCCYEKWLGILLDEMQRGQGSGCYFTNSDWNESQLLTYLCHRFPQSELFVTFVQVEQNTAEELRKLMKYTTVDRETKQTVPLVSHLYLLMQGTDYNRKSVYDALKDADESRITICEDRIGFRSILLRQQNGNGCLVHGSLNQHIGDSTKMVSASVSVGILTTVESILRGKSKVKQIKEWKERYGK